MYFVLGLLLAQQAKICTRDDRTVNFEQPKCSRPVVAPNRPIFLQVYDSAAPNTFPNVDALDQFALKQKHTTAMDMMDRGVVVYFFGNTSVPNNVLQMTACGQVTNRVVGLTDAVLRRVHDADSVMSEYRWGYQSAVIKKEPCDQIPRHQGYFAQSYDKTGRISSILVTNDRQELKGFQMCQDLVSQPLLFNGHKFTLDLRLAITAGNPVVAYLHSGVEATIAYREYSVDGFDERQDILRHVTEYQLEEHPKTDAGKPRKIKDFLAYVAAKGEAATEEFNLQSHVFRELKLQNDTLDMFFFKTLREVSEKYAMSLSGPLRESIENNTRRWRASPLPSGRAFQIIRLKVLLSKNCVPRILSHQIEYDPSAEIVRDALDLVGVPLNQDALGRIVNPFKGRDEICTISESKTKAEKYAEFLAQVRAQEHRTQGRFTRLPLELHNQFRRGTENNDYIFYDQLVPKEKPNEDEQTAQ